MIACVYLDFQVVEHGLGHLPFTEKQVVTPTGVLELRSEIELIFSVFILFTDILEICINFMNLCL